jgi:hypothetical protein
MATREFLKTIQLMKDSNSWFRRLRSDTNGEAGAANETPRRDYPIVPKKPVEFGNAISLMDYPAGR